MKVRVLSQRGGDWLRGKLVSVHPHASKTATLPATGLERVSTWLDSFSGRIGGWVSRGSDPKPLAGL